jgi:hypothetical protein
MKTVTAYALRLGDNGLVLSQRLAPGAATRRSWRSTSRWPISASTCWARRAIS